MHKRSVKDLRGVFRHTFRACKPTVLGAPNIRFIDNLSIVQGGRSGLRPKPVCGRGRRLAVGQRAAAHAHGRQAAGSGHIR